MILGHNFVAPPDKTSCTHLGRYSTVLCMRTRWCAFELGFRCVFDSHAHPFGAIHTYDCHIQITTAPLVFINGIAFWIGSTVVQYVSSMRLKRSYIQQLSIQLAHSNEYPLRQGLREQEEKSESKEQLYYLKFCDYYVPLINWPTIAVVEGELTRLEAFIAES